MLFKWYSSYSIDVTGLQSSEMFIVQQIVLHKWLYIRVSNIWRRNRCCDESKWLVKINPVSIFKIWSSFNKMKTPDQ